MLYSPQARRYREVVRRKAKMDDIDAHVIASLLRSGKAHASYVPDGQIHSLREFARLRARLTADRRDYLRQLIAQLDVMLPERHAVLGELPITRARGIFAEFATAQNWRPRVPGRSAARPRMRGARGFLLDGATGRPRRLVAGTE